MILGWCACLGNAGAAVVGHTSASIALPVRQDQPGLEAVVTRGLQRGNELPVFLADEALDFAFPVTDETQCHGLNAARGTGARQFAPQDGRQVETDQIVERAASEVGIDQRFVDVARMGHGVEHGLFRDGVEHHPFDRLVVQDTTLLAQHLQHVPGNRLTLAVRVRGQDQAIRVLDGITYFLEPLVGSGVDLPGHVEVFVRLYRSVLCRQITDMAKGRLFVIYTGFWGFYVACNVPLIDPATIDGLITGETWTATTIYLTPTTLGAITMNFLMSLSGGMLVAFMVSKGNAFWTYSGGLAGIITASAGNDIYHPIYKPFVTNKMS